MMLGRATRSDQTDRSESYKAR